MAESSSITTEKAVHLFQNKSPQHHELIECFRLGGILIQAKGPEGGAESSSCCHQGQVWKEDEMAGMIIVKLLHFKLKLKQTKDWIFMSFFKKYIYINIYLILGITERNEEMQVQVSRLNFNFLRTNSVGLDFSKSHFKQLYVGFWECPKWLVVWDTFLFFCAWY